MTDQKPLLIGEVCVDFTMPTASTPTRMRMGGVAHAARGLWAAGKEYAVAIYCPAYLVSSAERFLRAHGCTDFILLGDIVGAPNVIAIADVREVGHQGYEDILRDDRKAIPLEAHRPLDVFDKVVIFPGSFDLSLTLAQLRKQASITIDVAYDVATPDKLREYAGRLTSLVISTSSDLFMSLSSSVVDPLVDLAREIGAQYLLLKENRGGSRLFDISASETHEIPALLGETVNSVGVGDAFTAVFGAFEGSAVEAAWRGMQVATVYSQTTFPDDLIRDVGRQLGLPLSVVQGLGGVQLTWHERPAYQLYLAAPDFSYENHPEIESAVNSLEYHNFTVRRPVKENGEAKRGSTPAELRPFYVKDVELLRDCSAVFAIPLGRDPGTLVEVGMALEMRKPVIVYDPRRENQNTMVVSGSETCSADVDACLNAVFGALSKIRKGSM